MLLLSVLSLTVSLTSVKFSFVTGGADEGLGLDRFLAKHTSEDNASFTEILEESERRRQEKHAWLFEKEDIQDQVTS